MALDLDPLQARSLKLVHRLSHGEQTETIDFYRGATLTVSGAIARNDAGNPAGHCEISFPLDSIVDLVVDEPDVAPAQAPPPEPQVVSGATSRSWFGGDRR